MKLADLYFNLNEGQVIINGEYEGGVWRIVHTQAIDYQCYKTPRHCRGMIHLGDADNLLDALAIVGKL
jgi:hypothetical protein